MCAVNVLTQNIFSISLIKHNVLYQCQYYYLKAKILESLFIVYKILDYALYQLAYLKTRQSLSWDHQNLR